MTQYVFGPARLFTGATAASQNSPQLRFNRAEDRGKYRPAQISTTAAATVTVEGRNSGSENWATLWKVEATGPSDQIENVLITRFMRATISGNLGSVDASIDADQQLDN